MKPIRHLNHLIQSFCQLPGRVRWSVGLLMMAAYSWLFYSAFVAPTGFRWRAIYGDPDYPKGYPIHGIDISHHQGPINWHRLRHALVAHDPLRFVFVKATEGDSHLDTRFRENFDNAKEAGFIRGAYHFWSNQSPPRRQAYYFTAMVQLEPGDLPPVLDVE
ncbi:glycosyl hydrolase, family 25, partial [gut metagenome]